MSRFGEGKVIDSPAVSIRSYSTWRERRLLAIPALLLAIFFFLSPPVQAFEGRGGETVTIAADEVIEDDLYVGAQTVVINGVVKGDLFFGATTVTINGTVEGDVMGGGQSLIINGAVNDDVRVGLAALTLGEESQVGGDLLVGGYSLEAQPGSIIGGSLYMGGGQARLAGVVEKDVAVGVGGLEIEGAVWGDVNAEVGDAGEGALLNPLSFMPDAPAVPSVPLGLTLHESASIEGDINYRSSSEAALPAIFSDRVNFERTVAETVAEPTRTAQLWGIVQRIVALVLIGLLLAWLLRRPLQRAANILDEELGSSTVWGIIVALVTPVAILVGVGLLVFLAVLFGLAQLGLISGVLLSVGLPFLLAVGTGFLLVWGLISKIVVGYWVGRKTMASATSIWGPVILGLVLVAVLSSIPYLGILVNLLVGIWGLGAAWLLLRGRTHDQVAVEHAV